MRLVRYRTARHRTAWGWIDPADPNLVVEPLGPVAGHSLTDFLALGKADRSAALAQCDTANFALDEVRLLAPLPAPTKLIAVGRNYRAHAAESGSDVPDAPMLFGIFPSAVSGPFDDIVLPTQSEKVDWEGELGIVIGQPARNVGRADALAHIAGYVVLNDVSARDLQRRDGQWSRAKSFDTFKPTGPCIATSDTLGLAGDLGLTVKVNGIVMQDSRTAMMVFPVDELVEYISACCTLLPGDIIATGTPEGVGFGRTPPVFLKAGDVVETEIEGIGRMRNRVVAAPPPASDAVKEMAHVRA